MSAAVAAAAWLVTRLAQWPDLEEWVEAVRAQVRLESHKVARPVLPTQGEEEEVQTWMLQQAVMVVAV